MTVKELQEQLQNMPSYAEVLLDVSNTTVSKVFLMSVNKEPLVVISAPFVSSSTIEDWYKQ